MNGDGPRILVPLDGSELSSWVLDRGLDLLRSPGVSATLLGVAERPAGGGDDLSYRVDPRHGGLHAALAAARDRLRAEGIEARAEIRFGDPAEAILRELREGKHSLVAMTTHGRTGLGRVVFGSVALRVLQGSPAPLILFRPLQRPDGTLSPVETHDPVRFRRILALLDGSSLAEEILPPVVDLARLLGAEIRLFSAVPGGPEGALHRRLAAERLDAWSRRLATGGRRVSIDVRHGAAGPEALDAAREWGADLMALTTHGRTGAERALYGSVAEQVLRDTAVPLLVLRSRILAAAVVAAPETGPVVHVT